MIVTGGWPGRVVVGLNGRFGVRPADFAVGGDFDNPLLNNVDPGDETTEFVAVVQTLPGSGTVVFNDLGGFQHTGAADGTYTTTFELFTWAQGGPITAHTPDEEITTIFGSTSTAPGATLTATASLVPGSASGTANVTAEGVTLTAAASLLAGAASGTTNAEAPGVQLQASAALIAGAASADGSASAPGVLFTLLASLIAGVASGNGSPPAVKASTTSRTAPELASSGRPLQLSTARRSRQLS